MTSQCAATVRDEFTHIRAAQRDPHAFAPLYENYADLVWRFAMLRLGNVDAAADVTSATFARALAALPTFEPEASGDGTTFRSWLMTIARNIVIDQLRRERPSVSLDETPTAVMLVNGEASPEAWAVADEERREVLGALAKLSPTQRRIVELRLAGFTSAEIAAELAMSISAVNTAHFRAFARLRDLLANADVVRGSRR